MRLTRLFSASGLFEFLETTRWGRDRAALLKFPSVLARIPDVTEQIATHADPPSGTRRARVGMFLGCVSESILGETNRATRRVLLRNGCAVSCPSRQVCCGAIHYHAGRAAEAASKDENFLSGHLSLRESGCSRAWHVRAGSHSLLHD